MRDSIRPAAGRVVLAAIAIATIEYLMPALDGFPIIYFAAVILIGAMWPQYAYQLSFLFNMIAISTSIGLGSIFGTGTSDPIQFVFFGVIFSLLVSLLCFVGVLGRWCWEKHRKK